MNINNSKSIYFLGIGGIGMSALARYFHAKGIKVYGYDKTQTNLTSKLQEEGISVYFNEEVSQLQNPDLVIYTPAIPKTNKIFEETLNRNLPIYKRAEILGELSKQAPTIAIAGTHGKTSVSSLLAHILHHSGININAFLGGIALNFHSNWVATQNPQYQVMEADEFDRSFLKLSPYFSLITSIDADHLDIYHTHNEMKAAYVEFAELTNHAGIVFIKHGLSINLKSPFKTYSITEKSADYFGQNITIENFRYKFDLVTSQNTISNLTLGIPGMHNVENAVAASAIALSLGVSEQNLRSSLQSFSGVKRRFERIFESTSKVFYDDYAHHPKEIEAFLNSIHEMYPNEKICGIFQPHLFSRTKDFGDDFAKILSTLDEVLLLEIYPARELPISGINAHWLLSKINAPVAKVVEKQHVINEVSQSKSNVFLTIGAGDIDQIVEPLKQYFEKNIA